MAPIATYVFLGMGTDGLLEDGKGNLHYFTITPLTREQILKLEPGVKLNTLDNKLIYAKNVYNNEELRQFLNKLEKPICFMAHNGFRFHYQIIEMNYDNFQHCLPGDILCADHLHAFYDIWAAEKMNTPVVSQSEAATPSPKPYKELYRTYYFEKNNIRGDLRFTLPEIYSRQFGDDGSSTVNPDDKCLMMVRLVTTMAKNFVTWVDYNHCRLTDMLPSNNLIYDKREQLIDSKEEQLIDVKEEQLIDSKEQLIDSKEEQLIDVKEEQLIDSKEEQLIDVKEEQPIDSKEEQLIDSKEELLINSKEEQLIDSKEESIEFKQKQ